MRSNKFFLIAIISFYLFLSFQSPAMAGDTEGVILNPQIIDEKAMARDLLEYKVSLQNNSEQRVELYPLVNDFTKDDGQQEFSTSLNKASNLSKWIKISRGVIKILPGETIEKDLKIEIDPDAPPGKYYAQIAFVAASNRYDAKDFLKTGSHPKIIMNIEVEENIIEKAQLINFRAEKNIFFKPPPRFSIELKNIGNKQVDPKGNLLLYNRRGQMVYEQEIKEEQGELLPDKNKKIELQLENFWKSGKYKARIEFYYGLNEDKSIQDTIYFWILPWQKLFVFGLLLLSLIVTATIFIFKKTYKHHKLIEPISHTAKTDIINLKK